MPTITYVSVDGSHDVIDAPLGTSIMRAAVGAGLDGIVGECGGNAMCATCHVYVEDDRARCLPPVSITESEMLEFTASQRRATSRLSCQLLVTETMDGLLVHLPQAQE